MPLQGGVEAEVHVRQCTSDKCFDIIAIGVLITQYSCVYAHFGALNSCYLHVIPTLPSQPVAQKLDKSL